METWFYRKTLRRKYYPHIFSRSKYKSNNKWDSQLKKSLCWKTFSNNWM